MVVTDVFKELEDSYMNVSKGFDLLRIISKIIFNEKSELDHDAFK